MAAISAPNIEQATFGPYHVVFGKGRWHVSEMGRIIFSRTEKQPAVDFARGLASKFDAAGRYLVADEDRERTRLNEIAFMEASARIKARRLAAKNVRRRA